MDTKGLITSALTGVVAIVGTLVVTSMYTAVDEGAEALKAQEIRTIVDAALDEKMQTEINGVTYTHSQAFSLIYAEVTANSAAVDVMISE